MCLYVLLVFERTFVKLSNAFGKLRLEKRGGGEEVVLN